MTSRHRPGNRGKEDLHPQPVEAMTMTVVLRPQFKAAPEGTGAHGRDNSQVTPTTHVGIQARGSNLPSNGSSKCSVESYHRLDHISHRLFRSKVELRLHTVRLLAAVVVFFVGQRIFERPRQLKTPLLWNIPWIVRSDIPFDFQWIVPCGVRRSI